VREGLAMAVRRGRGIVSGRGVAWAFLSGSIGKKGNGGRLQVD